MSHAQHTPGPWEVIDTNDGSLGIIPVNDPYGDPPKYNDICHVFGRKGTDRTKPTRTTKANAKLICAAPDLAEALKALLVDPITSGSAAHYRDQCKIKGRVNPIELARAALAKAGVK